MASPTFDCPLCGARDWYPDTDGKLWQCYRCRGQLPIKITNGKVEVQWKRLVSDMKRSLADARRAARTASSCPPGSPT